jgi:hypothetical protein
MVGGGKDAKSPFYIYVPNITLNKIKLEAERMYKENGELGYHGLSNLSLGESLKLLYEGKCGEYALHLYTGLPWTAYGEKQNDYKAGDVGDYQVRTSLASNPHLIIRNSDTKNKFNKLFFLIRMVPGTDTTQFYFLGYQRANPTELKSEWLSDLGHPEREKVWAVPVANLISMSDLENESK